MRKSLLLLIPIFSISFSLKSQTLTQAMNEPVVGDNQTEYPLDTSAFVIGLPISVSGSTAVWNFQNLKTENPQLSSSYLSPSSQTNSSSYPGSTFVQVSGVVSTFFKSVNSGTIQQTELLGLSSSTLSMNFTNSGIIAKFPINYGSSSSDALSGTFTGFSFNGNCNGNITTTSDGLGTLNLPDNITLTNVLRVKSVQTMTFVVGFIPLATGRQIIYNYYHASQKFPVLSINYTSIAFGTTTPTVTGFASGSTAYFTPPVGVKENYFAADDITMYPNPVSDKLSIAFSREVNTWELRVVDITGSEKFKMSSGTGLKNEIDVANLPSGMYVVEIKTAEGSIRKKFLKE